MSEARKSEEHIADAARKMAEADRTVFLDQTCGSDSVMRRRVESMLSSDTTRPTSQKFDNGPTGTIMLDNDATLGTTVALAAEEAIGDDIGRYKLLEKIGEGGFGMVYVAEQTEPVKRRVALKIIKLGMDTRQVVARFEAERQALALMDHPNIAKVLDAGATETGRPFFVMELVRGTKITEHCDRHKLSTRKRLDLFILVCRAVEHAHQKGIIHRDIKPSNILVTMHDGVEVPKVIDFGIAKATQGNLTEKTVYTQADQFVGTPAYMSPEQAEAGGIDIDTRSDIYSLGVLLYELLTGETPLESKNLVSRGFDEMRRLIREWEPQLPSSRIDHQIAKNQTTVATRHGTDVPKLIKMVRGDLDWVVMKCLEKDRARRYDTAAELTSEIQRFLTDEPVMARPPSKIYRLQKMFMRNRLAFAAGGVVLLSLIVGLCLTTWFVIQEKQERDLAEAASQTSEKNMKIAMAERAKAEQALSAAREAHNQSSIDQQVSVNAQAQAALAGHAADAARKNAETALRQSKESEVRAVQAGNEAAAAAAKAQAARQAQQAAETHAATEVAAREEALKAQAAEAALRKNAETARAQADDALKQAVEARQQAEIVATTAVAKTAQATETMNQFIHSLDTLPPTQALKVANGFFTTAAEQEPWAPALLRERAEWRARSGDWKGAAADFATVENNVGDLAPLLAQAGDTNGFVRYCAALLAQSAHSTDPVQTREAAKDNLFAPALGGNISAAAALSKRALSAGTNDEAALIMSLAEYRQAHYPEAIDWANKALASPALKLDEQAQTLAVLAMAQQQIKQTNSAQISFERMNQLVDAKLPKLEAGDLGPDWRQWIVARTLTREASALINLPPPPVKTN